MCESEEAREGLPEGSGWEANGGGRQPPDRTTHTFCLIMGGIGVAQPS